MADTFKQRVLAGLWFMAAAALVIVPFFLLLVDLARFRDSFWLMLFPLLVSGLVGSLLGAGILDAQRVKSWWSAALRGSLVAIITFLLYAVALSAWEGYTRHGDRRPVEVFAETLFMILFAFGLIFGWMLALVGAAAGWMLHLVSRSLEKRSGAPR